jgi:hypothetical protein
LLIFDLSIVTFQTTEISDSAYCVRTDLSSIDPAQSLDERYKNYQELMKQDKAAREDESQTSAEL